MIDERWERAKRRAVVVEEFLGRRDSSVVSAFEIRYSRVVDREKEMSKQI